MLCGYIQLPNMPKEGIINTSSLNGKRMGWGIGQCVKLQLWTDSWRRNNMETRNKL